MCEYYRDSVGFLYWYPSGYQATRAHSILGFSESSLYTNVFFSVADFFNFFSEWITVGILTFPLQLLTFLSFFSAWSTVSIDCCH